MSREATDYSFTQHSFQLRWNSGETLAWPRFWTWDYRGPICALIPLLSRGPVCGHLTHMPEHTKRKLRCCLLPEALPDCFQESAGTSFLHLTPPNMWWHFLSHRATQRVLTLRLLAVRLWARFLTSLCLSFFSCKMDLIIGPSSLGCCKDEMNRNV